MGNATTKKKLVQEDLSPEELAAAVNAHFGPGTMLRGSDPSLKIRKLSTGVLSADVLLNGGFARGRHTELSGTASVGKTALSYRALGQTQQDGGRVAYVDTEDTFNPAFAAGRGIDLDAIAIHKQVHGPRCIDFIHALLRSGLYDMIVVDSIAALVPLEDLEEDMEKSSYGMQQAKMMSKALRVLTAVNTGRTSMVWINQLRDSIGGMSFGPKSTTSGGRAMSFYAGQRVDMAKIETLTRKEPVIDPKTGEVKDRERTPYGHRVLMKAFKNKTGGRPMAEMPTVFDYDLEDFDPIQDLIYIGRDFGWVHKNKQTWTVDEHPKKKIVGRDNFADFLRSDPKGQKIAAQLEEWIRGTLEPEVDEDGEVEVEGNE